MKQKITLFLIFLSLFSYAQSQYEKSWDQVLGSIYDEEPVLISANPNGRVDVIANVVGMNNANAQGFDVTKGYGGYDIWFCKLDAAGKVIPNSDKTYGKEGEESRDPLLSNTFRKLQEQHNYCFTIIVILFAWT